MQQRGDGKSSSGQAVTYVLKYANLCRIATGRLLVPESWLKLQDQEILSAFVTQKQTLALDTGEPGCAVEVRYCNKYKYLSLVSHFETYSGTIAPARLWFRSCGLRRG